MFTVPALQNEVLEFLQHIQKFWRQIDFEMLRTPLIHRSFFPEKKPHLKIGGATYWYLAFSVQN